MNTLGYLFILCAILLGRAVSRGRVMQIGQDLSDGFLAIVQGNSDSLAEVLHRTGDGSVAAEFNPAIADTANKAVSSGVSTVIGAMFVQKAEQLGSAAKGYRWAAAGPDYYDCSGLAWRTVQAFDYTGPRFFTSTVSSMPGFSRVTDPQIGDIALWPAYHMGFVTGPNKFYSARNPKSGIGETAISTFRPDAPIYLRYRRVNPSSKLISDKGVG